MRVDLGGNILSKPDVDHGYGLHTAAFVIHSAIYAARPDVMAVMHTHTIAGMALSSLKCGLLPLTFNRMYGLERSCQAQLAAMACNTELNTLSEAVVEKSTAMYAPGAVRRYGLLEWPALLRLLDRKDPTYRE
jgi:ribulose-5-phosphate 4-epimerase/fuculose-1-phosphate aldolase